MPIWNTVTQVSDGDRVEAATFNKPFTELADRTVYLKNAIEAFGGGGQLSSIRFTVRLSATDTPNVGDVVCLDPDTGVFVKALSSMSVFDPFMARSTAYAVGVLVFRTPGTEDLSGVVATSGLVDFSGFDTFSMLETGEVPVNGPYYVSSVEPGKITAHPTGQRIQLGIFTVNPQKSGRELWDSAFLWPQYGDLLSHRHRTYRLTARPAGALVQKEAPTETSLETVTVFGYASDGLRRGDSPGTDAFIPYLRLTGEWPTRDKVDYTVWLSTSDGASHAESGPPSRDFSSVYLHWTSSDAEEGSGSTKVEAFYKPVPVGKRGLLAELDAGSSTDLSTSYYVNEDSVDFRSWTIRMPDYAKGWVSNLVEDEAEFGDGIVAVYGVETRRADSVHVYSPPKIFELPSENPSVGDVLVIDSTTYQFIDADTDPSELDEGVTPVIIEGTMYATYRNIAHPHDDTGSALVVSREKTKAYVGAISVSYNGASLSPLYSGGGQLSTESTGKVAMLVCDDQGLSLSPEGCAFVERLSSAISLNNGCFLYVRAEGDLLVAAGTSAELDTRNGCPGAMFRYSIEMDEDFNSVYPPVPAKSGSLFWNGVELESDEFFDGKAVYSIGPDSLYWYVDSALKTPWPPSFSSPDEEVDASEAQRLLFHYVSAFHSETGPVISLHPAEGSPITVKRCGTTEDASVGDLELDVDLLAQVYNSDETGFKAVKASKNGRLLLGPLVEKIVAGPGIELQQTVGQPLGQGTVTIAATNATYSGEMDTIALENAKEEVIGMFPYIRLLGWRESAGSSSPNIPTGFIAKFQVPTSIVDDVYRVKLYATVFGEDSFENQESQLYAGVSMTYNILPNWFPISGNGVETAALNLKGDLIAPDKSLVVNVPFGSGGSEPGTFSYKAFDPIIIHNDPLIADAAGRSYGALGSPFPTEQACSGYLSSHLIGTSSFGVRPGYIVAVKFSRANPGITPAYTGKIGFINLRWSLVRASVEERVTLDGADIDAKAVLSKMRTAAMQISSANTSTSYQLRDQFLKLIQGLR